MCSLRAWKAPALIIKRKENPMLLVGILIIIVWAALITLGFVFGGWDPLGLFGIVAVSIAG